MLRFWWLMASHEPAPVLLPSLWEGGRERVMAPGGQGSTEAQREREQERKQYKDTERVRRMKDDGMMHTR